jgi:hypothetical protein
MFSGLHADIDYFGRDMEYSGRPRRVDACLVTVPAHLSANRLRDFVLGVGNPARRRGSPESAGVSLTA